MDYDKIIEERAQHVFNVMAKRVSPADLKRIRKAFELAREAHAPQKRKTGEPYILHPIAVATIAADELELNANPVIAAFLHDVVEDTSYTIEDVCERFGEDVAFLVQAVTKPVKDKYDQSKQVDNYRHILDTVQYDIRALLIKLSDRLHNMRTLASMRPDKQMKIAGETDYFYAPLANRLGFYNVKTELENLSFRFRCPHDYDELCKLIAQDESAQHERLSIFCKQIHQVLADNGITAKVYIEYRHPYSIWRKMAKFGDDFNHLKYRHFTEIVFCPDTELSEKDMTLKIYSILSSRFKEKPGGISNYIDSPKENGYQSFHVKLLADFGRWQEVHISSERMIRDSQLGCVAERGEDNIQRWIEKFRNVLQDIARHESDTDQSDFMEDVVAAFYNDDIMTFTPAGKSVILPQKATVLDFAYEVSQYVGEHAKYARINGFLASVKAPLRRGDVVDIFTDETAHPLPDWLNAAVSYKARRAIRSYLEAQPRPRYNLCPKCNPIPGEEVVGFDEGDGSITMHKRDCPDAIRQASQYGDSIVSVNFEPDKTLYPVTISVRAVDRYHLLVDMVDCISNQLHLAMTSFNTETIDNLVTCHISLGVHSFDELQIIMHAIDAIPDVDEVKRL